MRHASARQQFESDCKKLTIKLKGHMKKKFFFFILSIVVFSCSSPSHLKRQTVAKPALSDSSYAKWLIYYVAQFNLYYGNVDKPDSSYPEAAEIGYRKANELWQERLQDSLNTANATKQKQIRIAERDAKRATQNNSLTISPLGLVAGELAKLRLRVQHTTKGSLGWGSDFKLFYGNYAPGWEICPFIKLFPNKPATMFYFYVTALYGKHTNYPDDYSKHYYFYGTGGGIGCQIGKNAVWDFAWGLKYIKTNANLSHISDSGLLNLRPVIGYFGPQGVFDGIFAIGFRF
jgi:hypothetical protein